MRAQEGPTGIQMERRCVVGVPAGREAADMSYLVAGILFFVLRARITTTPKLFFPEANS